MIVVIALAIIREFADVVNNIWSAFKNPFFKDAR